MRVSSLWGSPPMPRLAAGGQACLRARCGPRYCAHCREACPHGALDFDPATTLPRIDADSCTACGRCAVACPTEVWTQDLPALTDNYSRSGDTSGSAPPSWEIACRRVAPVPDREHELGTTRPVSVPCILGLPGGYLASVRPPARVRLLMGDCRQCPDGDEDAPLERIHLLASLLPALEVRPPDDEPALPPPSEASWATTPLTRKGILVSAGMLLAGALASTLPFRSLWSGEPSEDKGQTADQGRTWSRSTLIERMSPTRVLSADEARLLNLGAVAAAKDAVCDACGLCVRSCPGDALRLSAGALQLTPARCTGCGVCVSRCPRQALRPASTLDLTDRKQTFSVLPASAGRCRCGGPLEPGRSSCLSCSRTADLLSSLRVL